MVGGYNNSNNNDASPRHEEPQPRMDAGSSVGYYTWWPTRANEATPTTHPSISLTDGRHGLVVDLGAPDDLCGDRWAQEQGQRA